MNAFSNYIILLLLSFCMLSKLEAQVDRSQIVNQVLVEATNSGLNLEDTVSVRLSGNLPEFVSFLSESTELNLTIEQGLTGNVNVSFSKVPLKDILIYLCNTYELEVQRTGQILHLKKFITPLVHVEKTPNISWDSNQDLLGFDLQQDTLDHVLKAISTATGNNIVVAPEIRNKLVDGFAQGIPIAEGLELLAQNNSLELFEEAGFFRLLEPAQLAGANARQVGTSPSGATQNLFVRKASEGKVRVQAENINPLDLIREVGLQLNADYYLMPEITAGQFDQSFFGNDGSQSNRGANRGQNQQPVDQSLSLQLQEADFSEVLQFVSRNSAYSFEEIDGTYIIGRRTGEGFRSTKVYQFQNRSAEGVIDYIPEGLLSNVLIDTLFEMNALVLSGAKENVEEVQSFLDQLDELVSNVRIEIILVDVQTNLLREIGLEAGVVPGGKEGGGIITSGDEGRGGLDYNLDAESINDILSVLAGSNILNLGQVASNFYVSLRAIEESGVVEVHSTPKLATLNSHAAFLSIGEKRYYLEQQVNFPGSDRPIPVQSNRFESVEANLSMEIRPIVSGDGQVTLQIFFEQSEFTAFPENAPPPQISRSFQSIIRVKEGDMIVLGGLERELNSKTRRGLPWLSRIPVIGWIFGKKRKQYNQSKLLIFIRAEIEK